MYANHNAFIVYNDLRVELCAIMSDKNGQLRKTIEIRTPPDYKIASTEKLSLRELAFIPIDANSGQTTTRAYWSDDITAMSACMAILHWQSVGQKSSRA